MCLFFVELSSTLASKWLASETHGLSHCKLQVLIPRLIPFLYIYLFILVLLQNGAWKNESM